MRQVILLTKASLPAGTAMTGTRSSTAPSSRSRYRISSFPPGATRAWAAAGETLKRLADRPADFERRAAEFTDSTSVRNGGNLGQSKRGDTAPGFEIFLLALEPGRTRSVPVKTGSGVHAMRLDRRAEGKVLPSEGPWRNASLSA